MSNLQLLLAWLAVAVPILLKLSVALGALGTGLEVFGGWLVSLSWAPAVAVGKALVFVGQKLEALGVDIPKLLAFLQPLLAKLKPPAGVASMLCLAFAFATALLLCACPPGTAGGTAGAGGGGTAPDGGFWPTVARCAPTPSDLIGQVTQILLSGGDIDDKLHQAAVDAGNDGAELVECAVSKLVDDWSSPGASRNAVRTDALVRARAFLAAHPVHVEAAQ